ncbi:YcxB family protein [Rhizobium sp. P38BS-XIX]|uniref:YcxB family protein n=1 Tax=Rhizobium sp. P38BS-XIX TaxID=2726740 RepID=UPI00145728CA|nr:YcxB family protein [Rhizobium sp. P38BS-XIX]
MVALAGFFHMIGMPWSELLENLPLFTLIMFIATFGVAFVIPLVLGPIIIRHRFRQDTLLRQTATVSWDEDAYEVEQPGIYNRIAWGDYSKWREGRHLFMFCRSDYSYQMLPKRVLTQEQIADIRRCCFGILAHATM